MDNGGAVGVAKKRTKAKAAASGPERKPMIAQLRGSGEWKAWIEKAARSDNRTVAGFLERAAERYAKEIGFKDEPPER